jgi:hypothetical protein
VNEKFFYEGNQIHNFMSSSGSGTVINYGSGSGSDFLPSYGSGSTSQNVTVPTVPVPQHCMPVSELIGSLLALRIDVLKFVQGIPGEKGC